MNATVFFHIGAFVIIISLNSPNETSAVKDWLMVCFTSFHRSCHYRISSIIPCYYTFAKAQGGGLVQSLHPQFQVQS